MKNLQKHLMAVTAKTASRLILTGVHFNSETNTMTACDSHRLLRYEYSGTIKQDEIVDLNTMGTIEGTYPDTERLIPNRPDTLLTITASQVTTDVIKELTSLKKNNVVLKINNESLELTNNITKRVICDFKYEGDCIDKIEMTLDASYLKDYFKFLLDHSKTFKEEKTFQLTFIGNVRPILFTGKNYKYLITPVRNG